MNTVIGFKKIYQKYSKDILHFALYLSGKPEEAEDITSETFVCLWASKNKVVAETVKAYLFKIAKNVFLKKQRNRRKFDELDSSTIDPTPLPDEITDAQLKLHKVFHSMKTLNEIDRMAIILKAQHKLTYKEIGQILGLSIAATKVRIYRARIKLAQLTYQSGDKK